jgi:hypothetical protein
MTILDSPGEIALQIYHTNYHSSTINLLMKYFDRFSFHSIKQVQCLSSLSVKKEYVAYTEILWRFKEGEE